MLVDIRTLEQQLRDLTTVVAYWMNVDLHPHQAIGALNLYIGLTVLALQCCCDEVFEPSLYIGVVAKGLKVPELFVEVVGLVGVGVGLCGGVGIGHAALGVEHRDHGVHRAEELNEGLLFIFGLLAQAVLFTKIANDRLGQLLALNIDQL